MTLTFLANRRFCPSGLRLRLIGLLLLMGPLALFANEPNQSYRLAWQSPDSKTKGPLRLNFQDAVYQLDNISAPLFHRYFPGQILRSARLTDVQTELLAANETPFLPSNLTTDFQVFTEKVVDRKVAGTDLYVLPLRKTASGQVEKLLSFQLAYETETGVSQRSVSVQRNYAANSVLATGNWMRLAVVQDGIYKVTYDYLNARGLGGNNTGINDIRLYGNGGGMVPMANSSTRYDDLTENAIEVKDVNNDGIFNSGDYFLFYGQGPNRWTWSASEKRYNHNLHLYSDSTYYFVSNQARSTAAKRIATSSSSTLTPTRTVNSFTDYQFYEKETKNYINSGRKWYGEVFDAVLTQSFSFNFPNLVPGTASLKSSVMARTSYNNPFPVYSYFRIYDANGTQLLSQALPNVSTSYTADFGTTTVNTASFTANSSDITFKYTFVPFISSATGYLDYISVNATRRLQMTGDLFFFRDRDTSNTASETAYTINGVNTGVNLWDISDGTSPQKLEHFISGNALSYTGHLDANGAKEFVLFTDNALKQPLAAVLIENQNLHALSATDLVIVAPDVFLAEAERLGQFHRDHDQLRVTVVNKQAVYNEFSSGAQDPSAIRDFMKMFYDRAGSSADLPRYLLLFGDGSFDPKDRLNDNTNFIPTLQSDNSVSLIASFTCDDFFGMLDDNEGVLNNAELVDLGIGRMPVKTEDEAREMVDKVIRYCTVDPAVQQASTSLYGPPNLAEWRNTLCFIADDQDHNLHLDQSELILSGSQAAHPVYNYDKINIDAYKQYSTPGGQRFPDVNDAIDKRMEKGAFLMNYTGHGGEIGWAAESILTVDMIQKWHNKYALPAFITATCEFSRYDDPVRTSAGELVLLNANGGGICLFTTVRLAFALDNQYINTKLLKYLFEPIQGEMPRTGDIQRLAKRENSSNRNVTLLGDPAIRLAYPKYKVQTTAILNSQTQTTLDTLNALSRVTIKGKVTDANGVLLSNFNGIVYPTVYDKTSIINTLVNDATGNDVSDSGSFALRKNILYKGKASVVNGEFTCSFIVPRDIAYQYGSGRLSYYAHNGSEDAQGYDEALIIGGAATQNLADDDGPEIKLYMNDEQFVYGSVTNESPSIFALLSDSSGINTVGNGIGHDITAMLDGEPTKLYVLNDYYESDQDSYSKGRVNYPLSQLAEGPHTLSFKAWDINNNSSETNTEFVVASSEKLALQHVLNYPNPFTTHTSFLFEHNQAGSGMQVQVQIYTVSGKLVKTLQTYLLNEGFRNNSLEWDGKDDYGDQLAKGVYLYRLKVKTDAGQTAQKMERLVILR